MIVFGPREATCGVDLPAVFWHTVVSLEPGLTGWAQINGRDELPIPVKVEFDQYYLLNRSMLLDLKIVGRTALKVILRDGVSH